MSKITYNTKTKSWHLLYKDPAKLQTHAWPYTRKCVRDELYPELPPQEKAQRRQEMLLFVLRLSRAELVPQADVSLPAVMYLTQLEKVCRSTHAATVLNSRVAVRRFRDFLAGSYSGICLHAITTEVAEAFFRSLSHLSWGTLNKYRSVLSYIMRRLVREQRERGSSLPYRNPFAELDLAEIKTELPVTVKRSFTLPQIRALMQADARFPEQEFVWRLLYMTGWRLSDILNLRWEQVNMRQRTLHVIHRKTARYGTATTLWLTEGLCRLFRELRSRHPESEYLFPQWVDEQRSLNGRNVNELRFIRSVNRRLDALGMGGGVRQNCRLCRYYSAHSMRSTVITLLKEHNFNTERIMYLCGHRGRTLEARAYNRFHEHPKESTADMLLYLERLVRE